MTKTSLLTTATALLMAIALDTAQAGPAQKAVLEHFAALAKNADTGFQGFSAERGKKLFFDQHSGGKPETPSCTTCHGTDPTKSGRTRAGKEIKPMALSRTPERFSDLKKVEKWFRRNCRNVMGRECTPLEKGDFITFMANQ